MLGVLQRRWSRLPQGRPAGNSQGLSRAGLTPVCFPWQLEQFNMMENAISSSSLYSPGSTLNYSQAAMMGLTGSHGSLPDTQQLGYPSHSSIPNIILTGEATCVASWAGVSGRVGGPAAARGLIPGRDGAPALHDES